MPDSLARSLIIVFEELLAAPYFGQGSSFTHPVILYRVIQEESEILWEMILCVILSKKVHMYMGPILNGYRDMVKRRYGPSCEHEQQLRNK